MLCQDYYVISSYIRCDQFDIASNFSSHSSVYTWKVCNTCVWMYTHTYTTHINNIYKNLLKFVTIPRRNMFKIDYTRNVTSTLILERTAICHKTSHRISSSQLNYSSSFKYQRNNTAHSIQQRKTILYILRNLQILVQHNHVLAPCDIVTIPICTWR